VDQGVAARMDAGFHRQIESRAWWTRRLTVQGAPAIDELGPAGLGQQLIQPGGNGLAGESLPPPMVSQPQAGTVVTGDLVSACDAIKCSGLAAWGVRQGRHVRCWRACGAVALPSRPVPGGGRPAWGPHRGCSWPGRGGLPDAHGGRGPGRARGAALAAHPPSGQPTASQTAGGGDRADGDGSTNSQRTEPADRPNNGHGNAGKDKPGKGEHGKGKDK
jgi:hypothetical protein